MVLEGVDYSKTANADWAGLANALKANGNHFVGRYAVNDKSPNGRGISAAEYEAMKAAGLGVFLYWESSEGWMTGGHAAGVAAAQNAQANIIAAGIPQNTPVYFACDFDAAPSDQAAIDDCLRGAASVIGADRVGIYGGYWIVSRCATNGSAKWFCQTSAWSGIDPTLWFEGNHLEQYNYNRMIYGTNCDDVRALKDNYGQATPPAPPKPKPTPAPKPPAVVYGAGMDAGIAARLFGAVGPWKYSEQDELSKLWLAYGKSSGFWPHLVSAPKYDTRQYWQFSNGKSWWRANDKAPIVELK